MRAQLGGPINVPQKYFPRHTLDASFSRSFPSRFDETDSKIGRDFCIFGLASPDAKFAKVAGPLPTLGVGAGAQPEWPGA